MKAPMNLLQGQAGVYRVASELMLRGYNPCFPAVDHGVDILIDEGVRIQVKSAHVRFHSKVFPDGAYWYKLHQAAYVSGNNTIHKSRARIYSEFCDFVVFWGIEGNYFWIAPSATFDGVSCVVLNPSLPMWHELPIEKIQEMHAQGRTKTEIANELEVSRETISRRLKGLYAQPSHRNQVARVVRAGLNRWDLIDAYLRLLRSGDSQEPQKEAEKEIITNG